MKRLEEEGIGRPSTYAPTVATIQRRGYVTRQGKALVPSFTAFAVTRLLREHFADYVDIGFTAEMEEILDEISNGQKDWLDFITAFYRGDGKHTGLETIVQGKEQAIDYPMIDLGVDPESGKPVRVRIGRYGPFLQLGESTDDAPRASVPEEIGPADLTLDEALRLLKAKAEGPKSLGADPKSGLPVYVMHGRFGPYVQLGENPEKGSKDKPKRASLDREHVRGHACRWPRRCGCCRCRASSARPTTGETILANRGRFGPVRAAGHRVPIARGRRRRLHGHPRRGPRSCWPSRRGSGGSGPAAKELRALGAHPNGGAPVRILDGRYGPYVTDGTTNASLPKGTAPEALTMEQAVELMNARAGAAPAGRRRNPPRESRPEAAPKRGQIRHDPEGRQAARRPSARRSLTDRSLRCVGRGYCGGFRLRYSGDRRSSRSTSCCVQRLRITLVDPAVGRRVRLAAEHRQVGLAHHLLGPLAASSCCARGTRRCAGATRAPAPRPSRRRSSAAGIRAGRLVGLAVEHVLVGPRMMRSTSRSTAPAAPAARRPPPVPPPNPPPRRARSTTTACRSSPPLQVRDVGGEARGPPAETGIAEDGHLGVAERPDRRDAIVQAAGHLVEVFAGRHAEVVAAVVGVAGRSRRRRSAVAADPSAAPRVRSWPAWRSPALRRRRPGGSWRFDGPCPSSAPCVCPVRGQVCLGRDHFAARRLTHQNASPAPSGQRGRVWSYRSPS